MFFQTFYSVFGVVGGPVVGVFCLGMFTRRANSRVCILFSVNKSVLLVQIQVLWLTQREKVKFNGL